MSKPLFFVSHKHDDALIAEKVAKFVRTVTGGGVEVFVSSSPLFEGPRVGKGLNQELKNALWKAGIVILIYSTADKDWSWCMWECGLADDPKSPETKVVVLQCRDDQPEIFRGNVRVQAWQRDSLVSFAHRFLEPDFCPGAGGAISDLNDRELENEAESLHVELRDPIAQLKAETWSAWPVLRVELGRDRLNEAMAKRPAEQLPAVRKVLLDSGKIIGSSSGSPQLFGKAEIERDTAVGVLVRGWQDSQPGRSTEWLDVLARQILDGARKKNPQVKKWHQFREVDADDEFVVGIGRVESHPTSYQFDCFFYGIEQVPRVTSVMTRLEKMFHYDLDKDAPENLVLQVLLDNMERLDWNRIPILQNAKPRYVVHISMVDRFVRKAAYANEDVSFLTFADLLKAKPMEELFANTFALVPESATVSDADLAMRAIPKCEDVFVTRNGSRDEAVTGWLTDWDIDRVLAPS